MKYHIKVDTPLKCPNVCIQCSVETTNEIHVEVNNQETSLFFAFLSATGPLGSLKNVGQSVKVPLCKTCKKKLFLKGKLALGFAILSAGFLIYGMVDKWSKLSLYFFFWGAMGIVISPFIYLAFKENSLKVSINKTDDGYDYFISNPTFVEAALKQLNKQTEQEEREEL